MSSKLLTPADQCDFEPMPWSTVGAPAPRKSAQRAPSSGGTSRPEVSGQKDSQDHGVEIARLEQAISQARAAGRAEGEAAARQQAQAEMHPVLQKLAASIQETAALRGRLRDQTESGLVRLAMAIARRVIGREVNTDPAAIAGVVKASLEKLRVQDVLRVRLSPPHKASIVECLSRLGATHVEVIGDPSCEPGAVIFETSRGNLDASIETQLREIENGLTDRFKGNRT